MKSCILLFVSCFASVLTFSLSAALTSQSYSQNGLIGQWDGIENAGVGVHNAAATVWIDLSANKSNFVVNDSVATFSDNGLVKNNKGYMATNGDVRTDVRTIEAVVSGAPSSGWVNAMFITANQTLSFANSYNGDSRRHFFFDKDKTGWKTAEKPSQVTICVTYASGTQSDTFYQNGIKPGGESGKNSWGSSGVTAMCIGGRASSTYAESGDATTKGYTIHAIRLYSRKLTQEEAVRHASIDQVRFFGAPEGIVGSSTYAIGATAGVGGLVSFDDVNAAPSQTATSESFTNGKSFPVALRAVPLPGWKFKEWSGDFTYVTAGNAMTPGLVVKAACGRGYHATFERTTEDGLAYIANGLVGLWDGIENAGEGLHDANATAWKDRSGKDAGDFLVQSGVASFAANGLKKTAKGFCATNAVAHEGVLTMESVVSGVPASGWVHPIFLSQDQTITFCNENDGTRTAFFDYDKFKWSVPERTDPLTVTVTYEEKDDKAVGSSFYLNGASSKGVKSTASGMYWKGKQISSIGGRSDNPDRGDWTVFGYTVHSVRLYNRALAPAEAAYNAAVDQRRFFGRPIAGFPYRITNEGAIECQLRAWTHGLGGTVKMGSGEPVSDCVATAWGAAGTERTATFVAEPEKGWAFLGWQGDVEAIVTGAPTDRTVTVRSKNGVALQAVFTQTTKYVRNGLIGCWDALENAGYGRHDASASAWTDLAGQSGDFQVNAAAGGFTANALAKTATGRLAFNPVRKTSAVTVEAVLSALPENAWASPIYIGLNKNISIKDKNRDKDGLRCYFYNSWTDGLKTSESPSEMTVAVRFDAQRTLFVNGVTPTGEKYTDSFSDIADDLMTVGGRKSTEGSDASAFGYRIHAIRLYDRALTPSELSRNAQRDAIRYFGAPEPGTAIIIR